MIIIHHQGSGLVKEFLVSIIIVCFIILKYSFGGFVLSPPYYVGAPIGIGGPAIGHGMLFMPIGSDAESKMQKLASIIAFGLSPPS
jgi:hypothetical protein